MAAHLMEIKLNWENGVNFTMKTKLDAEDEVTIVEIAENTRIASIWGHVVDPCTTYFRDQMNKIGNDMKQ